MSSPFVRDLLAELQVGEYRPGAWTRFLVRSWQRSLEDWQQDPSLVLSWVCQSLGLAALGVVALVLHGYAARAKELRRFLLLLLVQQLYVAVHLGMVQPAPETPRFRSLGAANFLSQLRGMCASLIIAAGMGHRGLATAAVAVGGASDALDGYLARRSGTGSRMGNMLDPMADIGLYGAATVAAVRRRELPIWFGTLALARFFLPVVAGLHRYFWRIETLGTEHTFWGKAAGVGLTCTLLASAASPRASRLLLWPASGLLLVAGAMQLQRTAAPTNNGRESATGTRRDYNEPSHR